MEIKSKLMPAMAASMTLAILASVAGSSLTMAAPAGAGTWSFGVISDTQWTVPDDGYNPNTVAANIIKQVDAQFVKAGVKLVVAVGDTVDVGSKVNIDTRALYAQDLYNAGIGFYPLRGNHEAAEDPNYKTSGPEFRFAYPQIGTGVNNNTPSGITTSIIPATDLANNPPAPKKGKPFMAGTDFSEPTAVNVANNSTSYSFEYNNATFVLLDQFDVTGSYYNSTIPQQQSWINGVLSSRPAGTQAFVFGHKNLLGENHKDNLFGGPVTSADPGDGDGVNVASLSPADKATLLAKQTAEDNFITSMSQNDAPIYISGHDHNHDYSLIKSPLSSSTVHQLIGQSDSSKFYTPSNPISSNETQIQQDLYRVGYYIFTVDGPEVTIDYYGDTTGGSNYGLNGGTFDFAKMSTIEYSLNGSDTIVKKGASYTTVTDSVASSGGNNGFVGTRMAILGGTNGNSLNAIRTSSGGSITTKPIQNEVATGWTPESKNLVSDILTLHGMSQTLGDGKTDEYVLSMSYANNGEAAGLNNAGKLGLVTMNDHGEWVNAVSQNFATTQKYVAGPWNSSYKLGTWGVDTATHTAWAVINYNGDFAVGQATISTP